MVDLISLVLNFVSVLQNASKKKGLKEKVSEVVNALDSIDEVFKLLLDAKEYHDKFEKFDAAALQPLMKTSQKEKTRNEFRDDIDGFVKITKLLLKDVADDPVTLVKAKGVKNKTPVNIKKNIENLYKVYPTYSVAINTFNENFRGIIAFLKKRNFGRDFDDCIILLENSAYEIRGSSDDIILNVTPIVAFFHFQIRDVLRSI